MMNATPSTSSTLSNLVAVTQGGDAQTSGAICWWRLSSGLDLAALEAAWVKAGGDPAQLPARPSPSVALRRACLTQTDTDTVLKSLDEGWIALVTLQENKARAKVEAGERGRVRLTKAGRLEFSPDTETAVMEDIEAEYGAALDTLTNADLGAWLVRRVDDLQAVGLRDTGGIYFVPRFSLPAWERLVGSVRAASKAVLSSVPAMHAEDATASILDALAEEVGAAAARIRSDVDGQQVGSRGLRSRSKDAEDLLTKVGRYEGLFGASLTKVRKSLSDLRVEVSVAITEAEGREAAAKAGKK